MSFVDHGLVGALVVGGGGGAVGGYFGGVSMFRATPTGKTSPAGGVSLRDLASSIRGGS